LGWVAHTWGCVCVCVRVGLSVGLVVWAWRVVEAGLRVVGCVGSRWGGGRSG
jgi:hypothetical protein